MGASQRRRGQMAKITERYSAVVATLNETNEPGGGTHRFTHNALDQLAKSAPGVPVLLNFDCDARIGTVTSAKNENGRLVVEMDIDKPIPIAADVARTVPGFVAKDDSVDADGNRIVMGARTFSMGITENPIEKDLPEMVKCLK